MTAALTESLTSPGLSDYVRTTPKRWPINTEVIDSPACAMPEFADYRRAYYLVDGSWVACSADTLDELLTIAVPWAGKGSRIVRVPMIPYYDSIDGDSGRPIGTSPWAGGTWGGRCGSTRWVTDPNFRYRDTYATLHALSNSGGAMQGGTTNYDVGTLQAWWSNGIAARKPALDGFKVECLQRMRHDGLCAALDIDWNWRDYAPWTDRGNDTQISLF